EASWAWDHPSVAWYRRAPEMWIYPLQIVACGAYLWHVRRDVEWDWKLKPCLLGILAGVVGIGFWLVPYVTGWIPAEDGFDPVAVFGDNHVAIWVEYVFRFARAVIIVALVEELFWRGYLMRWCVNRDFPQTVPLGQGSWLAYIVVTVAFMLVHRPVDYAGAFVYGSLAYALVVYTKRLTPVVVMHAVANLIMGICAIKLNLPHLW
ncbi:MAG: CAAX prenyl protease-related protein, partial [Akkermansia sp.]|nr:CAAX prenyl protease-related protein [Akkermansia sp.]